MNRPLVKDGTDPKQVRYAARKVAQREAQLGGSLRAVLATSAGRYVLWTLIEDANVFTGGFIDSGSRLYWQEGRRALGLEWLMAVIGADEGLYELMEREARQRDRRLNNETAAMHDAPPPTAEETSDGND